MNIKKNYIVLGGSYEQLEYINFLKEKYNLFIICLDKNKKCYASKKVDKFIAIDIKDKVKVLNIAKKYRVIGISSAITEHAQQTIYYVSKKLKFPHTSKESVNATDSKYYTKKKLSEHGEFYRLSTYNIKILRKILKKNKYVIKPDISSGQRGLGIISNKLSDHNIKKIFNKAKSFSSNHRVIIERYLEGQEINVVALINKGKIYNFTYSKRLKYTSVNGFGIVYRHEFIKKDKLKIKFKIQKYLLNMIKVFKLENAILFPQFILDKKNLLSLIEYGERVPGGKNNNIYHYATGINLYEINYLFSISKKTNLSKIKLEKKYNYISVDFLSGEPGPLKIGKFLKIKFIENFNKKNLLEHGIFNYLNDKKYHKISKLRTSVDRFYYFITGSKKRYNFKTNIIKIYKNSKFLDVENKSLKRVNPI